jgi:DivIVA domain-containing protein
MPDIEFSMVLRGYDPAEVDKLIHLANQALASPDPAQRADVERKLRQLNLPISLRGYDRTQVFKRLATLADQLTAR